MKEITLATAQFEVTDSVHRNLEMITALSGEAARKSSRLVLFPECALTGYPGSDMEDMSAVDPDRVREALESVRRLAAELKLFVAIGCAVPKENRGGWTNSLLVYDDLGHRVSTYSKIALTHRDESSFEWGKDVPVFNVDNVCVGSQICFDVRFPEGYRLLFKQGVHVVLHSYHQAGTVHWKQRRDIMIAFQRVRSSENGVYTVCSNTIGHNGGRDQWMPTMIVDPIGEIVTSLKPSKIGLAVVTIDAEDVREMIELDIRERSARMMDLQSPPPRPVPEVDIR